MKYRLVTLAVVAALATSAAPSARAQATTVPAAAPAGASQAEEIRLLREQLAALAARLEQLERAATAPPAAPVAPAASAGPDAERLADLEERVEVLQQDSDATVEQLAKTRAGLPEWAGRFTLRGDLRYRHERIDSGGDRAIPGNPAAQYPAIAELDRTRDRIRFRFGGTFRVHETLLVGMRLASGGDDPRSANVTLGDLSARDAFGLDQAYLEWTPRSDWRIRAGKTPQPWIRPGGSLFFDSDVNPEGFSASWTRGYGFVHAWHYWLQERGPQQTTVGFGAVDVSDASMSGAQLGVRYPFTATSSITAGAGWYGHSAVQGRRPFYAGNAFGNSTELVPFPAGSTTLVAVARHDYDVVQAFAQYERTLFDTLPFVAHLDVARNVASGVELDTAWSAGFTLGRAGNPRTWEVGATYQLLEKDALFGQWIDSNFGAGNTDTRGWVLRAGWAPIQNVTLNGTLFLNELNVDVPTPSAPRERSYRRLQLDANVRF